MAEQTHNSVGGQARIDTLVQAGSIGALHHHVHEAPPPDAVPPVQLPPDTAYFEDRGPERSQVFQVVADRTDMHRTDTHGTDTHSGPLVVALSGLGGVGKTTLGFQLARGLLERCPDGVLYVDLDDHRRDGAVDITDALGELLRPLGVRPPWLDSPSRHGRSSTGPAPRANA